MFINLIKDKYKFVGSNFKREKFKLFSEKMGRVLTCKICKKDFSNFETRCGHLFHSECLNNRLLKQRNQFIKHCPICKTEISESFITEKIIRVLFKESLKYLRVRFYNLESLYCVLFSDPNFPFESIIEKCIKAGWNVDEPLDTETGCFIHFAAKFSRLDLIKLILSKGADIEAQNYDGTALHIAASKGTLDIVKYLVLNGANVNAENSRDFNTTPINCAADELHYDIIKFLIERGAKFDFDTLENLIMNEADLDFFKYMLEFDMGITDVMNSCLKAAFYWENFSVLKYAFEKGADINVLRQDEEMSLLQIVSSKVFDDAVSIDILNFLLDIGEDINEFRILNSNFFGCVKHRKTALSIVYGHYSKEYIYAQKSFEILIKRGANLNFVYEDDKTLFQRACLEKKFDAAEILLDNGADIFVKTSWQQLALQAVLEEGPSFFFEKIKRVIMESANKDIPILQAVALAYRDDPYELFVEFLENGVDVNNSNYEGETPLSHACDEPLIDEILRRPVNLNIVNHRGLTVFLLACLYGNTILIDKLIDLDGINIHSVCKKNRNALHYAVMSKNVKMVKILIEKGVNYSLVDCKGNSPISMIEINSVDLLDTRTGIVFPAIAEDQLEIIRIFEELGAIFTPINNYWCADYKKAVIEAYQKNYKKSPSIIADYFPDDENML